jgi:6-phosphogluconolactonase
VTVEIAPSADGAARIAARLVAEHARAALASRGSCHLALSKAPRALLEGLTEEELPWEALHVHQVDERVAPEGDPDRNLTALLVGLPSAAHGALHAMPVTVPDLADAAARYEAGLPERLDVVHLGLGADGHTASLVPGDPALEVRDTRVTVTGEYQGRRRMTLTYPALEAACAIVWLVTGIEKADALTRFLARDPSIPAGRIENPARCVVADEAALAGRTSVR